MLSLVKEVAPYETGNVPLFPVESKALRVKLADRPAPPVPYL